jgi:hypothetical protein
MAGPAQDQHADEPAPRHERDQGPFPTIARLEEDAVRNEIAGARGSHALGPEGDDVSRRGILRPQPLETLESTIPLEKKNRFHADQSGELLRQKTSQILALGGLEDLIGKAMKCRR